MDKKLSDYLHLYLGCDVLESYGNKIVELNAVSLSQCWICVNKNDKQVKMVFAREFNEIKLVLRKLSDMTSEELDEYEALYISLLKDFEGDNLKIYAPLTKWSLSKHFDLFGLIEAGLAIDKTTLTAIKQ